jgi:hypothetical protein
LEVEVVVLGVLVVGVLQVQQDAVGQGGVHFIEVDLQLVLLLGSH